jgi:flagellar hook-associated protein 1
MTTSIMNTAQSGLQAAQAGLLVTSQNIAGASVDGFSRRNATAIVSGLAPNSSVLTGTGFSVEGFSRYYSSLLEAQRRAQQGKTSYSETLVRSTEGLDALLADQSNSLASAYSEFFNAAGSLVNDPNNPAYRSNLTFKADILVQRFVSMAEGLRVVEQDSLIALKGTLQSANDLAASLARVNVKIQEGSSPGNFSPSADYLDERDRLLMQLQDLIGGQSVINGDGTASHYINGLPVVDRGFPAQFLASELTTATGNLRVQFPSGNVSSVDLSVFQSGQAGAYIRLLNEFLPEVNRRLDAMAIATVATVNTVAVDVPLFAFQTDAGTELTDLIDRNGFPIDVSIAADVAVLRSRLDPRSSTYDTVLAGLKASNLISVAPRDPQDYDNDLNATRAGLIEGLRSVFVEPVSELVGTIGSQISSWVSENNSNQSIMRVLNDRRESVAGVNLDEEAANMLRFQQLYAASSRLIQAGNQMFETLLAMTSRS